MHWNSRLVQIAVLIALGAAPVGAQEKGHVALDFGYPPAIALLWRPIDRIALRPEISFLSYGGSQLETTWSFTPGVSALASIHPSGALTPYAGARIAGLWVKGGPSMQQWFAGAVIGVRYAIERHFGVSAETGLAYGRYKWRYDLTGAAVPFDDWNLSPTGRVSALLYF